MQFFLPKNSQELHTTLEPHCQDEEESSSSSSSSSFNSGEEEISSPETSDCENDINELQQMALKMFVDTY